MVCFLSILGSLRMGNGLCMAFVLEEIGEVFDFFGGVPWKNCRDDLN
jgi:hypothetical protein